MRAGPGCWPSFPAAALGPASARRSPCRWGAKADRIGEEYDQAGQELAAARGRLAGVQREAARGQARYGAARTGLLQAAWAAAGITIPRVTYDQWANLPRISTSALQPGDLLFYDGQGHVSMYVGGGYIIDAPRTGLNVQKVPMNTDWYAAGHEGAVRP